MRVIFLDIDGVLNSRKFYKSDYAYAYPDDDLDPYAVKRLNHIIEQTKAKVVISSSWRLEHDQAEIQMMMNRNGFQGEIIDMTDNLIKKGMDRGDEIQQWIEAHSDVESFVVIDDFNFPNFDKLFPWRFIQTDYKVGLSNEDVRLCVVCLKANCTK